MHSTGKAVTPRRAGLCPVGRPFYNRLRQRGAASIPVRNACFATASSRTRRCQRIQISKAPFWYVELSWLALEGPQEAPRQEHPLPLAQTREKTQRRLRKIKSRGSSSQGRKSLRLCLAGLMSRRFDPVAELSELPNHLPSAPLLRFFGDRWAAFFVTNSLITGSWSSTVMGIFGCFSRDLRYHHGN